MNRGQKHCVLTFLLLKRNDILQKWALRWDRPAPLGRMGAGAKYVCSFKKKKKRWIYYLLGMGPGRTGRCWVKENSYHYHFSDNDQRPQGFVKNPHATRFYEDIIVSFSLLSWPNPLSSIILIQSWSKSKYSYFVRTWTSRDWARKPVALPNRSEMSFSYGLPTRSLLVTKIKCCSTSTLCQRL